MDLQQPQKLNKARTTNSLHAFPRYLILVQSPEVTFPEQVWASDITSIRLHTEFLYMAVILDMFTRTIRGWELSRSLDHQLTLSSLRRALSDRVPLIHHSDQGVHYAATTYTDKLIAHGVKIDMVDNGKATQNSYAERVIRIIKEDEVYRSDYHDFNDAKTQIG